MRIAYIEPVLWYVTTDKEGVAVVLVVCIGLYELRTTQCGDINLAEECLLLVHGIKKSQWHADWDAQDQNQREDACEEKC